MWALLSDEQKQTYGEEYFEQALRSLEKYTNVVILKKEINSFNRSYT